MNSHPHNWECELHVDVSRDCDIAYFDTTSANIDSSHCSVHVTADLDRNRNRNPDQHFNPLARDLEQSACVSDRSEVPRNACSAADTSQSPNIKVYYQNVHGLSVEKLTDASLGGIFKSYDVVLSCETWTSKDSELDILNGFTFHNFYRKFRHPLAPRESGGIGLYIRKSLKRGIKVIRNKDDIVCTLKLDKTVFGMQWDVFLSLAYIVPKTSTHLNGEVFADIQDEIISVPNDSEFVMCMDANAHTRDVPEYFIDDIEGSDMGLQDIFSEPPDDRIELIKKMHVEGLLKRVSQDKRPLNSHGRDFIDLCKASRSLILNSRKGSDKNIGAQTQYDPNCDGGVVDYVICSPKIFSHIENFKIHGKVPESDHCGISFEIPANRQPNEPKLNNDKWTITEKFEWSKQELPQLNSVFETGPDCLLTHQIYKNSVYENKNVDTVATNFNSYVLEACKKVFTLKRIKKGSSRFHKAKWFNKQCRERRNEAMKAGERIMTNEDKQILKQTTKAYNAYKQRKKRQYKHKRREKLDNTFHKNKSDIWKLLNEEGRVQATDDMSLRDDLYDHFQELSTPIEKDYFKQDHLTKVQEFLKNYDESDGHVIESDQNDLVRDLLNRNFDNDEVEAAINSLKNNKSPGVDSIPSEFIKACQGNLIPDLIILYNYLLEKKEFPTAWAEGLKSAVHKSGCRNTPNNYRGITILGMFAKIFEILINNRFQYVNETFNKVDTSNGGFLKGSRTTDNIFILNGLVQRQLTLNKPLYLCFVDFSKAFDMINRDILFFKLINTGWSGKLLDTLRDLYSKTSYRFKYQGYMSDSNKTNIGVNQGGTASGFLFRKYLADLSEFLYKEVGVCIGNAIIAHLLWADDLILFSDSIKGLQKQLNGLFRFCSTNMMIVNELKTKLMIFGNGKKSDLYFNGKILDWVDKYKYLGNIISSCTQLKCDLFKENYKFLANKARRAIFLFFKKIGNFGSVSPEIMIHGYNTLIKPLLLYGSDIWGISANGGGVIDKVCLWFIRCVLRVKQTTSNPISFGEVGVTPPSYLAHANSILYYKRLLDMDKSKLPSIVFNELMSLNDLGFKTWVSDVQQLSRSYGIDLLGNTSIYFKQSVKLSVKHVFENSWTDSINDSNLNPGIRCYKTFKQDFHFEPYLKQIKNVKHRIALSRFRCSSHCLEIERGRHTNPITPLIKRLCPFCKVVDTEQHFITKCINNEALRRSFYIDICHVYSDFLLLDDDDKFVAIMSSTDESIMCSLGKFLSISFEKRGGKT